MFDRRRVYILPTAPGLAFGVVTLILLVGSINYMLQLGYLLNSGGDHGARGHAQTHSNLAQIVSRCPGRAGLCGPTSLRSNQLTNPTGRSLCGAVSFAQSPRARLLSAFLESPARARTTRPSRRLPARGRRTVSVPLPRRYSGVYPPRLTTNALSVRPVARVAYLTPAGRDGVSAPEMDAPPLPSAGGVGDAPAWPRAATTLPCTALSAGDRKDDRVKLAARSDELSSAFEAPAAANDARLYELPDVLGIDESYRA